MINLVRQQGLKWLKTRHAVVLMLLVGGLGVGISLATQEHKQTKAPVMDTADVDSTLVEGTKDAVPLPTERRENLVPASALPAYQVAIANSEGVRLKTIVNR